MQKKFAYIRVSSKQQNIDRQKEEMLALDISERDMFIDYQSGKDFNREKYQALKYCLRPGDILYVKSIDRLGRNYLGILEEWHDLTKNIKADIKVLDMPLLDTSQYKDSSGSIPVDFVTNIVLQILSYVAESERKIRKQSQMEGIAIAKRKGKRLGRPKIDIPQKFPLYYDMWKNKELSALELMEKLNLKRTTFYKIVHEYELKGIQMVLQVK